MQMVIKYIHIYIYKYILNNKTKFYGTVRKTKTRNLHKSSNLKSQIEPNTDTANKVPEEEEANDAANYTKKDDEIVKASQEEEMEKEEGSSNSHLDKAIEHCENEIRRAEVALEENHVSNLLISFIYLYIYIIFFSIFRKCR